LGTAGCGSVWRRRSAWLVADGCGVEYLLHSLLLARTVVDAVAFFAPSLQ